MDRIRIASLLVATAVLLGCRKEAPSTAQSSSTTSSSTVSQQTQTSATTVPATVTAAPSNAPVAAPATAPTTPASGSLANQETKWSGVVAEVTEFRRRGNTLTAKVRFRNTGTEKAQPDVSYGETYVMDSANGKKYEVLKDEKDNYIAALRSGYRDRWYERIEPGQSQTIWMKFPAPPAEVKAVTLQVPGVQPFEDLAIQDS